MRWFVLGWVAGCTCPVGALVDSRTCTGQWESDAADREVRAAAAVGREWVVVGPGGFVARGPLTRLRAEEAVTTGDLVDVAGDDAQAIAVGPTDVLWSVGGDPFAPAAVALGGPAVAVAVSKGAAYVVTEGGLARSEGPEDPWVSLDVPGAVADVWAERGTVRVATDDGVHESKDGGETWTRLVDGAYWSIAGDLEGERGVAVGPDGFAVFDGGFAWDAEDWIATAPMIDVACDGGDCWGVAEDGGTYELSMFEEWEPADTRTALRADGVAAGQDDVVFFGGDGRLEIFDQTCEEVSGTVASCGA